jgi:AraC family transcriptional regulator, regulatory protein of adaptative response / methylated-DNA-[protein]-cysteine methyltransferase
MNTQNTLNFNRIASAIDFIKNNFTAHPSLDEIATQVNMSPSHFQKMFTNWAGVSPKKFLQYISIAHAKHMLREKQATLFDTALDIGLSGTGRLHDLFINIEAMTPGEYKNAGENLQIEFSFASTNFGEIIMASTQIGICHIAFYEDKKLAFDVLQNKFSKAHFFEKENKQHENIGKVFNHQFNGSEKIKLHIKGTDFQIKVWETLLTIPMGNLATYGNIAQKINNPKASRAVGSAIGDNPIAYLIPCHRVIQSTGIFGGYMWGSNRKAAMIGWEAAKTFVE